MDNELEKAIKEKEQDLFELGKEIEDKKEMFPEIIRKNSDAWKKYMDGVASILESWHQDKSVWATAFRFLVLKYGKEFEIELPEDYENVPFLINIDLYPKEENKNIWTLKIMVIEEEKDE